MAVKYTLRLNPLTNGSQQYAATVLTTGTATLETIADRIVDQGTTVRRADVLAVLENALDAADNLLKDGFRVQMGGLVDLFPRIKGNFESPTDSYDPARHRVDIAAMPGRRLRNSFSAEASVRQIQKPQPAPSPVAFSQNPPPPEADKIQPGSIAAITGWRLKFDPAMEDEGIFFINTADGGSVKVETVQKNSPRELVFLVPTVEPNSEYTLEIRARHRGGTQLRRGRLDGLLSS
jgi:hypothetical protein